MFAYLPSMIKGARSHALLHACVLCCFSTQWGWCTQGHGDPSLRARWWSTLTANRSLLLPSSFLVWQRWGSSLTLLLYNIHANIFLRFWPNHWAVGVYLLIMLLGYLLYCSSMQQFFSLNVHILRRLKEKEDRKKVGYACCLLSFFFLSFFFLSFFFFFLSFFLCSSFLLQC